LAQSGAVARHAAASAVNCDPPAGAETPKLGIAKRAGLEPASSQTHAVTETPVEFEPRMEVLVGGACELHVDDGRVLRGELLPLPDEQDTLQIESAAGIDRVPRAAVRLLRLRQPRTLRPVVTPASEHGPNDGRSLTLRLPGLETLSVRCTATHSAQHGGLWLDVLLPDGGAESWHVPPRTLPLLTWLGHAATARRQAPRNAEELWAALDRPPQRHARHLGMALVESGQVTTQALAKALQEQSERRERGEPHLLIGQLLVRSGALGAEQLAAALADWMGVPVVDLREFTPEPEALRRVPRALAERCQALPLAQRDDVLVVAMADPWNRALQDELRFAGGVRVHAVAAAPQALAAALLRAYGVTMPAVGGADNAGGATAATLPPLPFGSVLADGTAPDQVPLPFVAPHGATQGASASAPHLGHRATGLHELAAELVATGGGADDAVAAASESDNTLVRMINALITEAVRLRASDIHVETAAPPKPVRVRLRVDGELVPCLELPARLRFAMVARLKIMAELDIAEHRKPQDGKIAFARFGGPKVELRVVTVPTHGGMEDVVLRLLSGLRPMPITEIGLAEGNLAALRETIAKPYGLLLICGPTGCGKTTTLHSVMRELNTEKRKIWTAEDPVEIEQEGLRQVQVNPRIGWTFAAAMRTFLRADPDVVMIGEMRDEETARIAVEASLTGHLVLSTLHTNSAPESIARLLEIGLDPYMFSDSLLAILAQRLVRRLCPHCRVGEPMDDEALRALAEQYRASANGHGNGHGPDVDETVARWRATHGDEQGQVRAWRHQGCVHCDHHGYRGRLGLHELMRADEAVREGIRHHAPASELQAAALAGGMRTLRQDGIEKMLQGLIDMPEVIAASNQ
jgi:type II secretory ATPase GspE/PulE/Tfp pilus assembly ATPase PilB-like protein